MNSASATSARSSGLSRTEYTCQPMATVAIDRAKFSVICAAK
jgi:hypothetical protein